MDKPISPWSAEFYLGSKSKTNDEIQHYGNRNSGRYKRGSGKDPDSTGGGKAASGGDTKALKKG